MADDLEASRGKLLSMAEFKKALLVRSQPPRSPEPPPIEPHVMIYLDDEGIPRYIFHNVPQDQAYDFVVGCCTAMCEALRRMGRPIATLTPPR